MLAPARREPHPEGVLQLICAKELQTLATQ
jgi:hypothetical protein